MITSSSFSEKTICIDCQNYFMPSIIDKNPEKGSMTHLYCTGCNSFHQKELVKNWERIVIRRNYGKTKEKLDQRRIATKFESSPVHKPKKQRRANA